MEEKSDTINIIFDGAVVEKKELPAAFFIEIPVKIQDVLSLMAEEIVQDKNLNNVDPKEASLLLLAGIGKCCIECEYTVPESEIKGALLSKMKDVLESITENKPEILQRTLREGSTRKRVVEDIIDMIPESDDLTLEVDVCGGKFENIKRPSPETVEELINFYYHPTTISFGKRTFVLNRKLDCQIGLDKGLVAILYQPLWIRAFAETFEKAVLDFNHEFALIWDAYAEEDDKYLTKESIVIKNHMKEIVKEIKS